MEVDGARLWVQIAGEGTPVVLLHPGLWDSRTWDDQWDAFAARHRVLRYDLRGYGRSDRPSRSGDATYEPVRRDVGPRPGSTTRACTSSWAPSVTRRQRNHVQKTVGKPCAGKPHARFERGKGRQGRNAAPAPLTTNAHLHHRGRDTSPSSLVARWPWPVAAGTWLRVRRWPSRMRSFGGGASARHGSPPDPDKDPSRTPHQRAGQRLGTGPTVKRRSPSEDTHRRVRPDGCRRSRHVGADRCGER
jgi:hypothetical protein